MPTTVDITLGLDLTIGSVPVSLAAEIDKQATETVYTFNGCVQTADIHIGAFLQYVGQQFSVTVQLPPELNLEAKIDYIAGQVIQTSPASGTGGSTELGFAAKFDLEVEGKTITLTFFADTILQNPAPATGNPYVVGAAIETELAFKDLPVVGKIDGFNQIVLTKVGFSYTNSTTGQQFSIPQVTASANPLYTRNDPNAKNANNYTITAAGNQQTFNLSQGGFALTAAMTKSGEMMNNFALPMALPAAPASTTPAQYLPATTTPPATSVHWIDVNKAFGPVNLQKVGLNYSGGEATFGLSAGFTLGGFTMDLEGLTITFPLPLPGSPAGNTVEFDLEGLSMGFQKGGFSISGAFLKVVTSGVVNYYGEVACQAGSFGLKALGGYTPEYTNNGKHYPASFFLYAAVKIPLGGPPFLFVTGFAGGFGINRTLILPTIDQLSGYILLPSNAPAQGATPSDTMSSVLPQLEKWFLDEPGEFEMIDAFALLTVSFGVDLQIGLLGSCSMTFPPEDPAPIAYIEIDIIASYTQSSGLLAVAGKLSPASFIYGGFVHLQGGFAFYTWFSGEHKGDFVVTVGGYSPFFTNKPEYYPDVQRLGMNFGLGPFQVTGQAYFALTPAMMMAGISMLATWKSGPISAWFGAGIDILLAWSPFHYQGEAYVTIGCSVSLGIFTITVHVGADLLVWGPAFGGTAHVDLDVVSFTINFGASQNPPPPVGWLDFQKQFLPQPAGSTTKTLESVRQNRRPMMNAMPRRRVAAPAVQPDNTNVIGASVTSGLSPTPPPTGIDWLVDADEFVILTNSTIPANNGEWALSGSSVYAVPDTVSSYNPTTVSGTDPYLYLSDDDQPFSATQVWNPTLNIAPMDLTNVQSFHTIALQVAGPNGAYVQYIASVSIEPVWLDSNAALWGVNVPNKDKTANDPDMVPNALTGFRITPIPRHPLMVNGVPLVELLFAAGFSTGFNYTAASVDTRYSVTSAISGDTLTINISGAYSGQLVNNDYVLSALADTWVTSQRNSILDDLNANGFTTYTPSEIDIAALATTTALVDWPAVELLGA